MTSYDEGPRDPVTGERLCHQCQRYPVPPSLGTKARIYCSDSCKQRAYESRRTGRAVRAAVETAVSRAAAKSRDLPSSSRDDAVPPPAVPSAKSRDDAAGPVAEELPLWDEAPNVPAPSEAGPSAGPRPGSPLWVIGQRAPRPRGRR